MNPLDWLLTALLLYSVVRAAVNGFFREAFALAGIVLGFALACWYWRPLAASLGGLLPSAPVAEIAAFLLILAGCSILAGLLGRVLRRGARVIGLGFLDRLGGAAFGLLRGTLAGMALLIAITAFLPTAPWVAKSTLAPYFLRAGHAVSFGMPNDLRNRLTAGIGRLHDQWQRQDWIKHKEPDWIKSGFPSQTSLSTFPLVRTPRP